MYFIELWGLNKASYVRAHGRVLSMKHKVWGWRAGRRDGLLISHITMSRVAVPGVCQSKVHGQERKVGGGALFQLTSSISWFLRPGKKLPLISENNFWI